MELHGESFLDISICIVRDGRPAARLCGTGGRSVPPTGCCRWHWGRLQSAARLGRLWGALCFRQLRAFAAAAGRRRSRRCSGHLQKAGAEFGHIDGTIAGAIRGVHSRPYPVLQGIKDRLILAACIQHPSSFGQSFPNVNGT